MKRQIKSTPKRLYLLGATTLLVGLCSALFIYMKADDIPENDLVFQFESSKMYKHNLEVIGGKMIVIADEFSHWFHGLWHGKSLAFTTAYLVIFLSFVIFFLAYQLPSDSGPASSDQIAGRKTE